jgi:hypothetical protein
MREQLSDVIFVLLLEERQFGSNFSNTNKNYSFLSAHVSSYRFYGFVMLGAVPKFCHKGVGCFSNNLKF